tara:strand:+ start:3192 stop:5990 length:2799 start_codon:yes stop_codon:yes gene_type:complete
MNNYFLKKHTNNTLPNISLNEIIPKSIKSKTLDIIVTESEEKFLKQLKKDGQNNKISKSYIGYGYHPNITPSVIQRCIFENPNWYTQYTPYQAEISQGRLEALINFQTLITELTRMPIANASLLDEATAAAEAMVMLFRSRMGTKKDANTYYVSEKIFPQTLSVLNTRAHFLNINLKLFNSINDINFDEAFGVCIQTPDLHGEVSNYETFYTTCNNNNCLITVITDLMSLLLLTPPGKFNVDVVVGSSQRFGIPMGYGGPHAAFFATKEIYNRKIPGRIIGATLDKHNNKAYRMALQTREQHIRKEKATSNICTAQALLAIMASFYACYHGPSNLKEIAATIHNLTKKFAANLKFLGFNILTDNFFDTVSIEINDKSVINKIKQNCKNQSINLNFFNENIIQVSINETSSVDDIKQLITIFAKFSSKNIKFSNKHDNIHQSLNFRSDSYLTQDCFNKFNSETNLMRYIKQLENKDYSLTTGMIPLGSCTMKLNAATEMIPLSWPEFANIHPFAPNDQTKGYEKIINELGKDLCQITGFNAISFQPNSGAQGEYAGLITIKKFQKSINQSHRNIALIPTSAHGTNPASAVIAGLDIVSIKCDEEGYIDESDLDEKINRYKENISVLMITYPSTHGVFEENITDICKKIHKIGAQVYMDGANMNAQVGLTDPFTIGADVCHLNLHKTFAIPHGGGGPGMGPICVASHLSDHLPTFDITNPLSTTTIAAAPYSSASILLISYAYIKLLGGKGLTESTKIAINNANYIKEKLKNDYQVLFTNKKGHVAHELIIDCRPFKKDANIDVEDIAKRLIDYSFHAPTMSWPVAGTLMIEPTESESIDELDRFCDAMINIKKEIDEIIDNTYDKNDNVLKQAPHTIEEMTKDDWNHSYSREKAAFPIKSLRNKKFWPTVGRLNQALGDRQLICTCDFSHELS